jgi:hypothetical protein
VRFPRLRVFCEIHSKEIVMSRVSKKARQTEQLILALLQHPTLEKAAVAAGISSTTAWRISKTPEFQTEYRAARSKAYGQSIARLQYGSTAAVNTILRVMTDPESPPASRLRAAEAILHHSAKGMELEDLGARVTALEQARLPQQEVHPC